MNKIEKNEFVKVLDLIKKSKNKVYQNINTALIDLYWEIGNYLNQQVANNNWGKGIILELAKYIKIQEPNIHGFSDKNLWRMKQFYEMYNENLKLSPLVRELTWTNNLLILSGSKSDEEREFYLNLTIKEKYSKRDLERQIKSGCYERTMLGNKKLSTRVKELPQNTSNIFKDIYSLEFLPLNDNHSEKNLRIALISKLKNFILELGRDFCFMGQEYKVQVGKKDFRIDLLFFHRELQCMVAFELKINEFSPSYLGQLEFYLEALDRDVKKENENPSIGVLLCRQKDDEVVEYALSRSLSPAIISQYETKLIPKKILREKLNEFYELLNENK